MNARYLIFALIAALFLAACETAAPAEPVSEPTAAPPAPTIPAPTASVPEVAVDLPTGSTDYAGEEQPAGYYKTPASFEIPFTFKTTEPFRGMAEILPRGYVFGIGQGSRILPEKQLLFWILAPDISTETAISTLRETRSLEFTSNETMTVAGLSGTQFDVTYPGEETLSINLGILVGAGNRFWTANSPHVRLRLIILSHLGRTMLIYIEAPEAEFERFVVQANDVLATAEFEEKP